jgi:hypothetical protein
LDKGRRTQTVAQHGGAFEIEILGRRAHLGLDFALNRIALAAKEVLGLTHQFAVILLADPVDTRGAAPLDLIEQAGPVAPRKKSVQERSRNSFCNALIVVLTEPALANGP